MNLSQRSLQAVQADLHQCIRLVVSKDEDVEGYGDAHRIRHPLHDLLREF